MLKAKMQLITLGFVTCVMIFTLACMASSVVSAAAADSHSRARAELVALLEQRGITDRSVLAAIKAVPRHEFVPQQYRDLAYADRPLPIGYGQTISQPYIVALMTQLLELKRTDRVLEIGTGSGYQAAVLAALVDRVHSIEIIAALGERARETFKGLGYGNIDTRIGDGYFGWPEGGQFDAIIVTAAPDHLPQPLLRQLREGGRLVVPVGPPGAVQTLWRVLKKGEALQMENHGLVSFVPLTRSP